MSLLRGLLLENVGLKLVALLLAMVVYLHVYTDRPATLTMSFPIVITDLPDSLAIVTQTPASVSAELKGTGKQLIRLRLAEPSLRVSVADVGSGHFQRALTAADLPMVSQIGLDVSRFPGPQMLELDIDRYVVRIVPVAVRFEGTLPDGMTPGAWVADPAHVEVRAPRSVLARLDSVRLAPIRLDAAHDTLKVLQPLTGPAGTTFNPPWVQVRMPIKRTHR